MKNRIMTDQEVIDRFGEPKQDYSNFDYFYPPFEMTIAWDQSKKIKRFIAHKSIIPNLKRAFDGLLHCYSIEAIHELGISQFGGCYNFRKMRGSSKRWSRHSWAIAIDLFPQMNKLRWKANGIEPEPKFSESDYDDMMQIFEDAGFVNYGRAKNYDWMHFEIAAND